MDKRKTMALLLGLLLGTQSLASAQAAAEPETVQLDRTAGVLATEDLSAYENHQALVMYADGSFDVMTYDSKDALADGLKTLAADENVMLVQPNYSYGNTGLSVDDALAGEQWALDNDGTFQMEEQENEYPVFDDPFEEPSAPWHWMPPQHRGGFRWFSTTADDSNTAATAGVDVNAEKAWSLYSGGKRDVVVALVDTGVDYTHEDLADNIWVNTDEIPGNGIDDDGNGYVDDVYGWNFYSGNNQVYTGSDDSHGTHGAGTIAAESGNGVGIAGLAQGEHVKVMAVKALGGKDGSGTTASIIQAIRYAEDNGAKICNLSLGTDQDDRALYQAMAASNMLFVVAAGNDGADTDTSPSYPASYSLDNIISVANLNYDGTLHSSSNYGAASVDLAAPGSYILSTTPGNTYSYMTGTSMAAPMVSAAAAMVYSYFDNITLADVKTVLLSSACPLDGLSGKTVTGGMLDLAAALSYDGGLSGAEWTKTEAAASSSTPVISAQLASRHGRQYLIVQVTDADGDLKTTAYASGILSAAQFEGGAVGERFTGNGSGVTVFAVSSSGIYTFYALDRAGHETVKTITIN